MKLGKTYQFKKYFITGKEINTASDLSSPPLVTLAPVVCLLSLLYLCVVNDPYYDIMDNYNVVTKTPSQGSCFYYVNTEVNPYF